MNQQTRTLLMFAVIAVALAIVFLWNRRERAEEAAALVADAGTGSATAGPASAPSRAGAGSGTPFRRIDKPTRAALLARMQEARGASTSTTGSPSASTTPRPALAPLPGLLEAKDVQRGVRELLPLLAECYDAALPRLTQKAGDLVVRMKFTGEPEVGTLIQSAEITGDEPLTRDPELMECLQQTMLSIELPPMRERGDVDVTYPLAFAPGN